MKLIFAQGNPGKQYERTRHNVGFRVLDTLADKESAGWQTSTKFKADIAEFYRGSEKVLLVKPLGYYNETGSVARALVDFYKLTPVDDVLVIHDELALPFGTLRVREKGSDAGNNGIKSFNAHLGPLFARIRIGIWNDLRDRMGDADFVLSTFTQAENEQLHDTIVPISLSLIDEFIAGTLEASSHTHADPLS